MWEVALQNLSMKQIFEYIVDGAVITDLIHEIKKNIKIDEYINPTKVQCGSQRFPSDEHELWRTIFSWSLHWNIFNETGIRN